MNYFCSLVFAFYLAVPPGLLLLPPASSSARGLEEGQLELRLRLHEQRVRVVQQLVVKRNGEGGVLV